MKYTYYPPRKPSPFREHIAAIIITACLTALIVAVADWMARP